MSKELYGSWSALTSAVYKKAPDILSHVRSAMEKALNERIEKDIYDVYTPKVNGWVSEDGKKRATYHRTNRLKKSAIALFEAPNILVATSHAWPNHSVLGWSYPFEYRNEGAFLEMLETGARGGRLGRWSGGFNRYAVANLQAYINEGAGPGLAIHNAIIDGITKEIGKGYKDK